MMNNLAYKTCNCDLDPMISIMERNSENILALKYVQYAQSVIIDSKFQAIDKAIIANKEDITDTEDLLFANIDEVLDLVDTEDETILAVLKDSAEIDYIEDAME